MRRNLLALLIALILVFAAYAASLNNEFLLDDKTLIQHNSFLQSASLGEILFRPYWEGQSTDQTTYRPLASFTFYLSYRLHKLSKAGYHLTNLIILALAGWIVFLWLTRSVKRFWVAMFGMSAFILHPAMSEVAVNVVGRSDILAIAFLVGALLLEEEAANSIQNPRRTLAFAIFSLLLFLAALFSKEFAILFIPMWVLQVFLLRDRTHRSAQKNLLVGYALGLLCVVFIFLLFRQFAFERSLAGAAALSSLPTKLHSPLSLRLDLAAKALGRYFLLLIVPYPLKITYEASSLSGEIYPTTSALSYGAIALWIVAFAAAVIRRSKKFAHALLWLPLSISIYPLLIILPWKANINLFAERFLSLSVVGWALLVALLIEHLWPLAAQRSRAVKKAVIVIGAAYLALFLALDIKMSRVWHDDLSFASYLAKHSPESATAHNNLAVAYAKKGEFNKAIGEFEATLKITQNFKTYIGLGMMHNELGDWKEAIVNFNEGLRRYPQGYNPAPLVEAYLGLGKAHENLGNTTQARQAYQAALNIAPGLPMAADALKRLQTSAEKQK